MSIPEVEAAALCEDHVEREAAVFAALAHPLRVRIVRALSGGEMSVTGLAGRIGISVANASQHAARLRIAGLVTSRRDGTTVLLQLRDPRVIALCDSAAEVGRFGRRFPGLMA